jgi:hypothetical protein
MSYTVATPGPKARPGTVSAASALLFTAAALHLVSIVLGLLSIGAVQDVFEAEFANDPDAEAAQVAFNIAIYVSVGVGVLLAAGATILGVLVGKGKNPARIVTWVLAGIGVLCFGCGTIFNAAGGALNDQMAQNADPEALELQRRIEAAVPAWQNTVSIVISILLLIIYLAIIILLALPASNEFFRKEQEVWVPPAFPAGDPGYPAGGGFPPAAPPASPPPPAAAPPPAAPPPAAPGNEPGSQPPGGLPPAPPPPQQ